MRLSGALQKKRSSELSYREAVKNSSNDETIAAKQVRQAHHSPPGAWKEAAPAQIPIPGQGAACAFTGYGGHSGVHSRTSDSHYGAG